MELTGFPSPAEIEAMRSPFAATMLESLPPMAPLAEDVWETRFPAASADAIDLMRRLLSFDPAKRPTAAEALQHPYLAAYRDAPEEELPTPEIEMNFEAQSPSKDELRDLVYGEVLRYHPNLAARSSRV